MIYINSFNTEADVQSAIDNGTLTKPYVAYVEDDQGIDWNSLEPHITGITFSAVTWVTDIPSSGGTATSGNCSFNVYGVYADGSTEDVTSLASISGSLYVPSTTAETREKVGTLTLTASYSGFTDSDTVDVYQEEYVEPVADYDGLTFVIVSGGSIYWKAGAPTNAKTIEYAKNGGAWTQITSASGTGAEIQVNAGDVLWFRGDNESYATARNNANQFTSGATTAKFIVKGNIMSMVNSTNFTGITTCADWCFTRFFYNNDGTIDASQLILPATTLGINCYDQMFIRNVNMVTAPELPAPTLSEKCYMSMLQNCTSLNYIKCLATDISATSCTNGWVNGVASTGTFVTPSSTAWVEGRDGIPTGWTRVNA